MALLGLNKGTIATRWVEFEVCEVLRNTALSFHRDAALERTRHLRCVPINCLVQRRRCQDTRYGEKIREDVLTTDSRPLVIKRLLHNLLQAMSCHEAIFCEIINRSGVEAEERRCVISFQVSIPLLLPRLQRWA